MLKRNFLILAVLIILLGTFLFISKNKSSNLANHDSSTNSGKSSVILPSSFSIVLLSQNQSAESGIATFEEKGKTTKVKIKLVGFNPEVAQAAHIEKGSCKEPEDTMFDLKNVINGESEAVLKTDVSSLNKKLPLILAVHESDSEASVHAVCGEISHK